MKAFKEMATEEGQTGGLKDEDKWVQEKHKTLEITMDLSQNQS